MLVERLAVAVIVLTVLSTSRQEDLPLHRTLVKRGQDSIAGSKTRARKFYHENSSIQDETIRNISSRIHSGLAKQFKRKKEEERLKAESAGEGNGDVKGGKSAEEDDEDKKTLAQQVAEGKYGLIHTELFQTPPKRPGILTYKINPEVPKDNVNNFGGLNAEEIWLAENHLLVLAGGGYTQKKSKNWPPIDDYSAPRRQVKIPPNPKVPPPFPIQLTENGPIELIRGLNGSLPRPIPFFPPSAGELNATGVFPFFPPPPPGFALGNFTPGGIGGPPPGFPFPLPLPNGSIPELPPFPPGLPPFPPANWTDLIDEDDPSIYYPPPYDFFFPKDNSSYVPAGPLVPGIVLPPPPDFFAPYDNATKPTKTKLTKPVIKKVKYQPPKQFFDVVTKLPDISDNSLNTMSNPYYPRPTTEPTRPNKPSVQVIKEYPATDEITNEVTPSHGDNKDDWVPIPAPRPYYITGPAKPLKENVLVIMSTPKQEADTQGYDYEVPVKPLKLPDRTVKYPKDNSIPDFYNGNNDNHVYPDEPLPKEYRPISRKPKTKTKSTVAPAHAFHAPVRTGGKSLQTTYYFYEDPHSEENIGLTPPKPNQFERPQRPSPPSIPPPKPTAPIEYYVPKEPVHIKPRPLPVMNVFNPLPPMSLDTYELRNPTTSTTQRPSLLDYFYFNGDKNGGYNFMIPGSNAQLSPKSTSRPIFEYSYTAPGYKDETKKSNAMDFYFNSYPSTMTTSKPTDFLYTYDEPHSTTPAPQMPLSRPENNEIFSSTPRPSTTTSPPQVLADYDVPTTTPRGQDRYNYQRTSTQKPWRDISGRRPVNHLFTTPHPFYAFFTHHDESLVDDITKKYFTLFGQKIRRPEGGLETTTPLSEVPSKTHNNNYKYNYDTSYDDGDYSKNQGDYSRERNKENSHEYSAENSAQNSQEQYQNYDQVRPNYNSQNFELPSYSNSKESYYQQDNYRPKGNVYQSEASTEDPSLNKYRLNVYQSGASTEDPSLSKYRLTNSFRTTTSKPKTKLTYQTQSPRRPSQIISLSNSFNVGNDETKHKSPSLDYEYDYDYDKQPSPSLHDDTRVNNYKNQYKEYEAEWLPSLSQQYQDTHGDNGANQFISYKLPGNGNGHFFFLTPQAVQLEELANAFLYPSNVETRNNFYSKRNTPSPKQQGNSRTRRKPDETSTQSTRGKQNDKKSK
uniref:Uncharacterized protein n=1 Tax=Cacopsylla melanoneura TaxID=428564 RepID=A0A8D8QC72_9HEMI